MANTQTEMPSKPPFRHSGRIVIFAGAGICLLAAGSDRAFSTLGLSPDMSDFLAGLGVGCLLSVALIVLLKSRRADSGDLHLRIDEFQAQQRRMLVAIAALVAAFGTMAILHPLRHNGIIATDFAIEFALLAVAGAAALAFGVGFLRRRYRLASDDEFVKALRMRAVRAGYMIAIAGGAAAYAANLFWPDAAAVGLPAALLAAVLIPCAYYLIAERRASGE
jgi:hypothetical protein